MNLYIGAAMAKLDLILFLVFGTLVVAGLTGAAWCLSRALRVAGERDGDLKMFFWALGSLLSLVIAGMSAAYIVLPILFHARP